MTWPSAFTPGTLGYMKDRIADEIARPDLTTRIAAAISDAIAIYQKERFRFSESRDSVFNTVIGQDIYTTAASPVISSLFYIDYLTVLIGNDQFDIPRREPEVVELLATTGTSSGQPYVYSYYNESIRLYPNPNAIYQMRIAAHLLIAAPAADSTAGNRWMTDAERLIRSRAKYELAINITKDPDEIALNTPHAPEGQAAISFKELRGEANRLTARGVVTAMQF